MANQPFDREVINVRERPLSSDINLLESYSDQALRYLLENFFARGNAIDNTGRRDPAVPAGDIRCFGDSLMLQPELGLTLKVMPGMGLFNANDSPALNIGGIIGLNDLSPLKPVILTEPELFSVPTPDPTNPRIDILEVSWSRLLTDSTSRDVLNATTGTFAPASVDKTMSWAIDGLMTINGGSSPGPLNYKTGTPAALPVGPTPTPGYAILSSVNVPAAAVNLNFLNIVDNRLLLLPGGLLPIKLAALWDRTATPTGLVTGNPMLGVMYPGVRVGGYQSNSGPNARTTIFISAGRQSGTSQLLFGDLNLKAASQAFLAVSDTRIMPWVSQPPTAGVVDALRQAALASALVANVPADFAIGQLGTIFTFGMTQLSGGPLTMTQNNLASDSQIVFIDGFLSMP